MAKKTFIVVGNPRGGTSLVAGSLIGLGVYMGEYSTKQYEDEQIKSLYKNRLIPQNLPKLIEQRNAQYPYWGFKLPNTIYFLEQAYKQFINPHFIFVRRDLKQNTLSCIAHDGQDPKKDFDRILGHMKNHREKVDRLENLLRKESLPILSLELSKVQSDTQIYLKDLQQFCGLPDPPETNYRLLTQEFLNPSGGYNQIFLDQRSKLEILS